MQLRQLRKAGKMNKGDNMLVVTGFFENETFIPDNPVSLPQRKRVIVTIEEEKANIEISFKELAVKAKTIRERIEAETGTIDVQSLIQEGRR
jgi:ribosomal protein L9